MLIYGVGNHLRDMLEWHPDLASRIERIFDKDPGKWGKQVPGCGCRIESPEAMRELPHGTCIVIAAILHYVEIEKEIRILHPGLYCMDIDEAYPMPEEYFSIPVDPNFGIVGHEQTETTDPEWCFHGEPCIIYSTGAWGEMAYWDCLGRDNVLFFVDSAMEKQGRKFLGRWVFSPEILRDYRDVLVVLAFSAGRESDSVEQELRSMGLRKICRYSPQGRKSLVRCLVYEADEADEEFFRKYDVTGIINSSPETWGQWMHGKIVRSPLWLSEVPEMPMVVPEGMEEAEKGLEFMGYEKSMDGLFRKQGSRNPGVSFGMVVNCYRYLLGREPEDAEGILDVMGRCRDFRGLRESFLASTAFRQEYRNLSHGRHSRHGSLDLPITYGSIAGAYRYILGREPEKDSAICEMVQHYRGHSFDDLRMEFLSSAEFKNLYAPMM